MYGKALTDADIKLLSTDTVDSLDNLAIQAYKKLIQIQKRYCDNYLTLNNEKEAAINAGYSVKAITPQLCRIRTLRNICLYISVRQELDRRAKEAENRALLATVDADNNLSKEACRRIIGDPDAKKTEVLYAVDILAKLNGVYKVPNTVKSKSFGVKLPDKV
jgi:phage terminase small subunit